MPYDGSVTFAEAEAARKAKLSRPQARRVPQMLEMIDQLKSSKKYHIFNVGPWAHIVNTGSTGQFFIPPCPEGTEYVEMTSTVPAIVDELIVKDEAEYTRLMEDGKRFAKEIVGEGRGRNPAYSLRHAGVFLGEGDVPTAQEKYEATKSLQAACAEIVAEIRTLYSTDRKLFAQVVRPEIHYAAAKVLNLQGEAWMVDNAPVAQVKCKLCGALCAPDVATCPAGHIINPGLYREYMEEQQALEAEFAGDDEDDEPGEEAEGAAEPTEGAEPTVRTQRSTAAKRAAKRAKRNR